MSIVVLSAILYPKALVKKKMTNLLKYRVFPGAGVLTMKASLGVGAKRGRTATKKPPIF